MKLNLTTTDISYFGVTDKIKAQSMVECRFPGDVVTVLSVTASVNLISYEAFDGEIAYRGRALLTMLYEDAQKSVCRTERGMEFSHRAACDACAPSSSARVLLREESVSVRREGSGVYVSVIVGADISVINSKNACAVVSGEGLVVKQCERSLVKPLFCDGKIQTDDEFETEYVGDVLTHYERAHTSYCHTDDGSLCVGGEIVFTVCALRGEEIVCYERTVPFKGEIPCDAARKNQLCEADISVESVKLTATTDEDKGKCRMLGEFTLSVSGTLYSREQITVMDDCFSLKNELSITAGEIKEEYIEDEIRFTERVSGVASLGSPIDFSDSLKCLLNAYSECECSVNGGKEYIDGVLFATLIVKQSDGAHRGIKLEMPYSLPVSLSSKGARSVSVAVCSPSARQRREGEAEVEVTLKLRVKTRSENRVSYIEDISLGEEIPANDSAFSLYTAVKGEELWDMAKRLNKEPEEVKNSNKDLKFPLKGYERILIYRKKDE